MSFALVRAATDPTEALNARVLTILDSLDEANDMADELRRRGLTIEVWHAEGCGMRIRLGKV